MLLKLLCFPVQYCAIEITYNIIAKPYARNG
jgi:hypothetical protein